MRAVPCPPRITFSPCCPWPNPVAHQPLRRITAPKSCPIAFFYCVRTFSGGSLSLCGSISPGNLARGSVRYLFLVETDKFPISAGSEGDPLLWMGCAYILIRVIKTGSQKLWLWFGLWAGIGLENKHSMLIFGFAVVAGLLLTPGRKFLRSPWF